jgi:hypothetical protein
MLGLWVIGAILQMAYSNFRVASHDTEGLYACKHMDYRLVA